MTMRNPNVHPDRALTTDDDLQELLLGLLERANQRQLWLVMLDADRRITGPLMPLEGLPTAPQGASEILFDRLMQIADMVGAESIVLVWERCGPALVRTEDLAWARAAAEQAGRQGPVIRAQFILHDAGLRRLTPDDLI